MNIIAVTTQGFSLFRKGSELKNSDQLKNAAFVGNILTLAVAFISNFWPPAQQYLPPDIINPLAALVAAGANTFLLPSTNAGVGFGVAKDAPIEIDPAGNADAAPADADRDPAPRRMLRQPASPAKQATPKPARAAANVPPAHRDDPVSPPADNPFRDGWNG